MITRGEWAEEMVRRFGPDELIAIMDEIIIRDEAARMGITAPPERVRAKVEEVAAYYGSMDALEKRLKQLGMTLDDLKRRCEVLVLLDEIARREVKISDEEVRRYYEEHADEFKHGEQVRARMMLLSARGKAGAVMEALKAGGDFAGLAKALSEDPYTREKGGDMGWFERGDYTEEITKWAFKLKPGEISTIFQGPDGWYIIKVEGKRPAGIEPLSKVADRIRARLVQDRLLEAKLNWLRQARQRAKIAIKDRRLAKAVRQRLATAPPPVPLPGMMTPEALMAQAGGPTAPGGAR